MSCPYFCRFGADRMDFRLRGNEGLKSAYFSNCQTATHQCTSYVTYLAAPSGCSEFTR